MTLTFGTDGVRGDAESELSSPFVYALGRAAARVIPGERWVLGRDTRASGERIERALSAGLAAEGREADLLEVVPTPGVAALAAADGRPGAVISASHNRWTDNGVKLFLPGGLKLTDDVEESLEAELSRLLGEAAPADEAMADPSARSVPEEVSRYRDQLVGSLEGRRLDGLRLGLDCGNGAASRLAPEVFEALGATVRTIHAEPDGRNINERCGSTDPRELQALVVSEGLDLGLAFDGDADRVLAVDEQGKLVDGDEIIAMCAIDLRDRGMLAGDTVAVTVMSNLGFRRGMGATGIRVIETPVGDRNVLEALDRNGLVLGGEQSGHVIFRRLATTGDGILTGTQIADLMMRTGRFLSDLAGSTMSRYPQVLRNVRVSDPPDGLVRELVPEIVAAERELGEDGRVLVRASGTEPLVRVMVEAPSTALAEQVSEHLVQAVGRLDVAASTADGHDSPS